MITTINEFRKLNETIYYSSHGQTMKFSQFIELEVEDRQNYEMDDVQEWIDKYNIKDTDDCIWITPDKKVALNYSKMNYSKDLTVYKINGNNGVLIEESDDGDDGYLFIFKKDT